MAQWHGISKRKATGGRRVPARGKRSTEISSEKQFALIGDPKRKIYRTTGGNVLVRVLSDNKCNVNDKNGKTSVATINTVIANDANPNYIRRNILTKGAVVETDKGNVKITSRPGHDGILNGVIVE
ncbi:MAG: 30S ribosomal protein S8e [Euryarchaeota archaeon]|jgi:small subunit ribosomal protein S8e|nr:30S ribosomal protein S8e [Euryarchaeota archaeon]|tara:strand:- start:239 stop:616 length:378 start_codon:yes stop_codon:yes gene_type:complete